MPDIEVPETDASEDVSEHDVETPHVSVEVPEADAIEQAQAVATSARRELPRIRDDVPEADAMDQAYEVELDDDYFA